MLVYIYGEYFLAVVFSDLIFTRANRAQYAEISFQSVADDDINDAKLPSMQGVIEDEGEICFPTSSCPSVFNYDL